MQRYVCYSPRYLVTFAFTLATGNGVNDFVSGLFGDLRHLLIVTLRNTDQQKQYFGSVCFVVKTAIGTDTERERPTAKKNPQSLHPPIVKVKL